jgi:agmatine/peptidylarginine deiminase
MIADQDTNIVYISELLQTDPRFTEVCNQLISTFNSFQVTYKFLKGTKDIWARDYMPIQVNEDKFIEYRYDPDYLQEVGKEGRDIKTYPDIVCDKHNLRTIKTEIILDGGNVIKSNNCVILTDKIFKENALYYTESQLIDKLKELFEIDSIITIPWDKCDEYGHADGMLRFIDDNTVLINGYFKLYGKQFQKKFFGALEQNNLDYRELNFDVPNPNADLNWGYINFLQTKDLILVPKFNIEEDDQALNQIKKHFPKYSQEERVAQLNMADIVEFGGALNCITWTIKEGL